MTLSSAAPVLVLLLLLLLVGAGLLVIAAGRLDLRRSVLVHVPRAGVWEGVRHFPSLHARHGKARSLGRIEEWILQRGDGEGPGTVWRAIGWWGDAPYWAEVEIVAATPGRALAIALLRDSLGTHHGLRRHLGSLTLEELGPGTTKLTWRLRARLRGVRLRSERLLDISRLQARLFDQGLRSIKVSLEKADERPAAATLPPLPAGPRPARDPDAGPPRPPRGPGPPEAGL